MLGGRKTVIGEFLETGMISVTPVSLLSVRPRGCSQQGHIRYVLALHILLISVSDFLLFFLSKVALS